MKVEHGHCFCTSVFGPTETVPCLRCCICGTFRPMSGGNTTIIGLPFECIVWEGVSDIRGRQG